MTPEQARAEELARCGNLLAAALDTLLCLCEHPSAPNQERAVSNILDALLRAARRIAPFVEPADVGASAPADIPDHQIEFLRKAHTLLLESHQANGETKQ